MRHVQCLSFVVSQPRPVEGDRLTELVPWCVSCRRYIENPRELTNGQTRSEWESDREESA